MHRVRAVLAARPARPARARVLLAACAAATATMLAAGACQGPSPNGDKAKGDAAPGSGAPGKLPEATTHTTVHGAPRDRTPEAATGGLVVHPETPQPVLDAPGGRPIATLPVTQLGSPTWVPVVGRSGAWIQVLLPSKPNQATGWMSTARGGLRTARTPYLVRVDVGERRLELLRSGRTLGRWTVAVGASRTPTPPGRTFLLALLQPAQRTPSPLLVPLGTHSATLDTFGGGPGTVALHGWPDPAVFGRAVTHGCVRVPDAALRALSQVPLGTLVLIND
jgi:hypothetical protein